MDTITALNSLKRHVFFDLMNLSGRAFILVQYSDNVILGNRGFTKEEKENGIILVFNPKMNFLWDEYGITATLVFGTSPQKCYIPDNDIIAVYSPDLNCQFLSAPYFVDTRHKEYKGQAKHPELLVADKKEKDLNKKTRKKSISRAASETDATMGASDKNVIKVDFTKKRK